MKTIIIILGLLSPFALIAQENTKQEKEIPFDMVETMPEFPGGEQAMYKFIIDNIIYPTNAKEQGIAGKVYVRFVVEKDGSITDVKTMRDFNPELDAEAIRVIKMMPKWKHGTQQGKPVRVMFTLPINFKLD